MATAVKTRRRRHDSRPPGSAERASPPPTRRPKDDRFRAFLGIVVGILGGVALWLVLIQIIRMLA
jgi:hypothetical protein